MSDMSDLPIIDLPGSDNWRSGYDWGAKLEAAFPNEDAADFAMGCAENDFGPSTEHRVTSLTMVQQGANDGDDWIWHVSLDDGSRWKVEGGCDYTGWDCQSSLTWEKM